MSRRNSRRRGLLIMACPVKVLIIFILNGLASIVSALQENEPLKLSKVSVIPRDYDEKAKAFLVKDNEEKAVSFDLNYNGTGTFDFRVVSSEKGIADVDEKLRVVRKSPNTLSNFTVKIKGVFLGRAWLHLYVNKSSDVKNAEDERYDASTDTPKLSGGDWYELPEKYEVKVSRVESALSHSFTGCIIILVCLANVAMGCKTELSVVKETLKKPIGPLTGMFSQFVLMPVISYLVGLLLKFDDVIAFGLFATGCSPGGSASNMYTYLLAGDVSLSVTMTFCSTLAALGMVPLWLFTLGVNVIYNTDIQIPFENIATSLVGLIVPVIIGMLIQWKKPNWAKYIVKGIRPLMIIFFIFVFTVGVYANLYIFEVIRGRPEILLAGALIPYLGFFFGGVVALVTRQSWKNIRTIAIETGIQNTGIAIVLLKLSLPPPDNDISIVPPIAAAIFTPVPMMFAIGGREIYLRCFQKKKSMKGEAPLTDNVEGSSVKSSENGMKSIAYQVVNGDVGSGDEGSPEQDNKVG